MIVQTWHVEIGADECRRLLAEATLGRLAVLVDGRPEIYPVNHVFDPASGCVTFPTGRGTKLRAALGWPYVGFEVDGLDPDGTGGWSVLVVGRAEEITDPEQVRTLAARRQVLWVAGPAVHWLRIVPVTVTGRRISSVVAG